MIMMMMKDGDADGEDVDDGVDDDVDEGNGDDEGMVDDGSVQVCVGTSS